MHYKLKLLTLALTSVLFCGNVLADGDGTVNFKGKLIVPPNCTIDSNKDITVDFGNEVLTSRVDGKMYKKKVEHNVKCEKPEIKKMKVQLRGDAADFDAKFLKAIGNDNLGISITVDGKAVPVNTWANFTYKDSGEQFLMEVTPVKNPDSDLEGGDFTASATLMVDYE